MANRSYLYSTDAPPRRGSPSQNIQGLHEWDYDIPLTHCLLASANPRENESAIFNIETPIAVIADYDPGLSRLDDFLRRVNVSEFKDKIAHCLAFLNAPDNRREYVLLEGGEIFAMSDEPVEVQNERLLVRIAQIDSEADAFLDRLRQAESQRDSTKVHELCNSIGLGTWSNVLYYDLRPQRSGGSFDVVNSVAAEVLNWLESQSAVVLPLLPLRSHELLQVGREYVWFVGRPSSVAAVAEAWEGNRLIGIGQQGDPKATSVTSADALEDAGSIGHITSCEYIHDDVVKVSVGVVRNANFLQILAESGLIRAEMKILPK